MTYEHIKDTFEWAVMLLEEKYAYARNIGTQKRFELAMALTELVIRLESIAAEEDDPE